jgi:hypothetical protein
VAAVEREEQAPLLGRSGDDLEQGLLGFDGQVLVVDAAVADGGQWEAGLAA